MRIAVLIAALLVLCGTPAVWAVVQIAPSFGPTGTRSGLPSGAGTGSSVSGPRSPRAGDPPSVRAAWVRAQIDAALAKQAAALLAGDERAFLSIGEPGNAAVQTELVRRFRSLRVMRVTRWEPLVRAAPKENVEANGRTEWTARLRLRHCFVVPECEGDDLQVESRWVERDGAAIMVDLDASTSDQNGPRPWEVADLRAAVGKRAVVATTAKYGSRLPALLAEADKAAVVADRFVVGEPPPDRYLVFFAGSAEWKQWYSGNRPDWAAGYAVPTSAKRTDVVLNATETPTSFLDDIMRHELTHVASLRGAEHQDTESWWLIEGLAEHAELHGRPASQHDAVAAGAVRTFVRSANWNGTVAVTEPPASAALKEAGARYGIAFLAVRRLVERFGEARVIVFFKAIVHQGKPLETASQESFGAAWSAVQADCVSYIRRTAG